MEFCQPFLEGCQIHSKTETLEATQEPETEDLSKASGLDRSLDARSGDRRPRADGKFRRRLAPHRRVLGLLEDEKLPYTTFSGDRSARAGVCLICSQVLRRAERSLQSRTKL